jgi:hypothetical protein
LNTWKSMQSLARLGPSLVMVKSKKQTDPRN